MKDENIAALYLLIVKNSLAKASIKTHTIILPPGENTKNFTTVETLVNKVLDEFPERASSLIALGGGVIGDITGFASSIILRGINFVQIPTTLLSQVDSSVGGKTGINSTLGKNLIGTFYQPEFVIIDISTLNTLPHRELVCGYGEILKHSLILNKKFFLWLKKNGNKIIKKNKNILKYAILKSCMIKTQVVSMDENENDIRQILNFGHTFGHAFEATKNFSSKLNHGEAVLLGMMTASDFAFKKRILPMPELNLIKNHYLDLNLPMNLGNYFKKKEINKIIYFMIKDKKNFNKKINLILLKNIGKVTRPTSTQVDANEIRKFLNLKLSK